MNKEKYLIQLWILRILEPRNTMNKFVQKKFFSQDDVACFLDFRVGKKSFDASFKRSEILEQLRDKRKKLELTPPEIPRKCRRNCALLGKLLNLNHVEQSILAFQAFMDEHNSLRTVFWITREENIEERRKMIARAIGTSFKAVKQATLNQSTLIKCEILHWSDHLGLRFRDTTLAEKLIREKCTAKTILKSIASIPPAPTLKYSDFPHITKNLNILRPHIKTALSESRKGVNIFIHGPPGTGKSELSRIISKEMKTALFEVSFQDDDGDAISGERRLTSLITTQLMLAKTRTILVFDEAEDIFTGSFFDRSIADKKKAWINRMLESNPIPTIWISNRITGLDPAFVRRFDLVFEIQTPPKHQRIKTYQGICCGRASSELIEDVSNCKNLTPAVVARAFSVAERIHPKASPEGFDKTFTHLIKNTLKAQGHNTGKFDKPSLLIPKVYDLNLLNCDTDLNSLSQSLAKNPSCRICLYGPPGTGKTTFGHWLSKCLDKPLHLKKASDILSKYVGEAEQNLAQAFSEAEEEKAILMIDEVDGFLQDRRNAKYTWERSQINEMLTQIESFSGLFIASTNLMDGLDQAALRRFDLKLHFGYMKPHQTTQLLSEYSKEFNLGTPTPKTLESAKKLSNCTTGDFANVARQHRFRNYQSPDQLLQAIEGECQLKEDQGHRRMGF